MHARADGRGDGPRPRVGWSARRSPPTMIQLVTFLALLGPALSPAGGDPLESNAPLSLPADAAQTQHRNGLRRHKRSRA